MKYAKFVALIIVISLVFIIQVPSSRAEESGSWTFMVYMAADNTLAPYAADDLAEMMSIGSNENLNIVVLYDSTENGDSVIYYIERGQRVVMERLSEVNTGSPYTLEYFLNWSMTRYHTQHYFLDFWDHGNFYGGVCLDHGDWLTLGEIRNTLVRVENYTGKDIDVVGFDACRMGIIEIFYSLRDVTKYVVASEKDEPASGWPYDWILENMANKTAEEVANLVVDKMYEWSKMYYSEEGISTTMVSVNMSRLPYFIDIFNSTLEDMLPVTSYYSWEIINASNKAERYEMHSDMDLHSFLKNLMSINDYKIRRFASESMKALEHMSYYKVWNCPNPSNGIHANESHGIGIFFPTFFVPTSYRNLDFSRDTLWDEFLSTIFSGKIERKQGTANTYIENETIIVEYTANVSYVDIYIQNENDVFYSGRLPASGIYNLSADYGIYDIYIYGYNQSGVVVWTQVMHLENLKRVRIEGKFFMNDEIAKGAKITLLIGNRSYVTEQSSSGFVFFLYYPSEITYNMSFQIHVDYGILHKNYTFKAESLKGNDTVFVIIREYSFIEPPYVYLFIPLLFIFLAMIVIFLVRGKSKKRARRDSNPRPRD